VLCFSLAFISCLLSPSLVLNLIVFALKFGTTIYVDEEKEEKASYGNEEEVIATSLDGNVQVEEEDKVKE